MPAVSIVMSSYNHERFVAEAVESVLSQDYDDWEMIIRDDGSDDRTPEIVASFRDPRIRNLDSRIHIGGAASLNRCIQMATGEYVAVMNSDDVMLPHRLSTQVSFMRDHPEVAACFSHAEIVDLEGAARPPHAQAYCAVFTQENRSRIEWLRYFFRHGNCLCHPSALLRRSIFAETGFYDPLMLQLPDFDKWVAVCAQHEIHIHQAPLLRFRVLEGESNASADSPLKRERIAYEFTKVLERYARTPILDQLHEILPAWIHPGSGVPQRLLGLANAALSLPSSPHHFFALDCLRLNASRVDGTEAVLRDDDIHGVLALNARPFSLVFSKAAQCRIFFRSPDQSFSDERVSIRVLEAGAACHDIVALPAGTTQVRLEFDEGYSSLQIPAMTMIDGEGREAWSLTSANPPLVEITGARQLESSNGALCLVREGGSTRLLLPEMPPGDGWRLRYSVVIQYNLQELVRDNERLSRQTRALAKSQAALQKAADSALQWRQRSWLKRLFGHRQPPDV